LPEAVVSGELHLLDAISDGRGLLFATAHTAGWETVGPLLSRDHGLRVMIAERPERDPRARVIQDGARKAQGLLVAHVGDDPLSALPLARHLRDGGAVALQIDRSPPQQRARDVALFGARARIPEGPLRLAALTGRAARSPSSPRAPDTGATRSTWSRRSASRAPPPRPRWTPRRRAWRARWSASCERSRRSGSTSATAEEGKALAQSAQPCNMARRGQ
jgi:hypothetical protein